MGTMNKMRENTGIVLWILVFAFGVIWVLQDSGGLDAVGIGTGVDIAVVDGDPVPYQTYAQTVQQQAQQYQQQTGESMPPQLLEQQRELILQSLIENKLREHEMNRLGISVTGEEIYEMVTGDNPHEIIRSYFSDEQGNVDRDLLQNFIENPDANEDWIQIEDYLRSERRRQKMDNLISATVRITDRNVEEEYRRRNLSVNVEWAGLPYASIPNDSVVVSERDLRRFYDDHRDEYARNRAYDIAYVSQSKLPAAEDTAAVFAELERMKDNFAAAEDDSLFLLRNVSRRPFSDAWFGASDLDTEIASVVFPNPEKGAVLSPVAVGSEAHLIKIRDIRPAEDVTVRASHILLRAPEENENIRSELVGIRDLIQSGEADFAEMARQYSEDASAAQGGDLGWFGPGRMVAPFEEAAFGARVNQVVGPIKTQFGYHLIVVVARTENEVNIADFALEIDANVATLNQIQEQLEDLRYFAEETGSFDQEAQRMGMSIQRVRVEEEQVSIPGIGSGYAVLDFLETAEQGSISDIIELDETFILVHVDEIVPEGYQPFEEVQTEIEPRAYIEKKKEVLVERLERAYEAGGFDNLSSVPGIRVQNAFVTFESNVVPGLGAEPLFVGTALALDAGASSGIVAGDNTVFALRVTQVNEPAPIMENEQENIRQQLLQQRQNAVRTQWIASLREHADIEDFRRRFRQQQ